MLAIIVFWGSDFNFTTGQVIAWILIVVALATYWVCSVEPDGVAIKGGDVGIDGG